MANSRNKIKSALIELDNDYSKLRLLFNNSYQFNSNNLKIGIAGSKGYANSTKEEHAETDEKLTQRELQRMKTSLESLGDVDKLVVMMHYPPTKKVFKFSTCDKNCTEYKDILNDGIDYEKHEIYEELFIDLISDYNPDFVIFGHILNLKFNPITYKGLSMICVSSDALDFNPIRLEIA